MTKRNMMLMSAIGAVMAVSPSSIALDMPRHKPKPHWKETQSDSDREEKLRKAEEKRQRKAEKRGKK